MPAGLPPAGVGGQPVTLDQRHIGSAAEPVEEGDPRDATAHDQDVRAAWQCSRISPQPTPQIGSLEIVRFTRGQGKPESANSTIWDKLGLVWALCRIGERSIAWRKYTG